MKKLTLLMTLILIVASFPGAYAKPGVGKDLLIEKYEKQLKNLTTARDSLRVLYYLFDLSDRKGQKQIAWQLYETAGRAQDTNAQMDMLRNLAVFNYKNDSIIKELQLLADRIPNEDARAATKTFIFNQQVSYKSGFPEDEKHMGALLLDSIVNSHDLRGDDVYDRIALLYQMIQYIGTESEGSLFVEFLDKYADLIDRLPESDYPLKNQFYTTSAIFHSRINGDQRRAVIYDKKLLEIMDTLQKMYINQKRKFRNYDANKYISYRRILSNYKVLSPREIEDFHDSVMMLVERDPDVKDTYSKGRTEAYYHYAKGEYNEAIPYIRHALDSANLTVYQRMKLDDMMIHAAKAVGDTRNYTEAMEDYIRNSQIVDSMRTVTTQREMMLRNSITNAPLLQTPYDNGASPRSKGLDIAYIAVTSVLAAILLLYMVLYVRLKRKLADIQRPNSSKI